MNNISIISNKKLNAMFEEEAQYGREYIDCTGRREVEGFLYTVYKDTRTGKEYAVREIRTVHMGFNSNEAGKVEEFVAIVEREGACKASWGVTGRTRHLMLAQQLKAALPQYEFELDYDRYLCKAKKRLPVEIPVCKMCGRELGVAISENRVICVSDYLPDNPYCLSCQIEHCLATNCLACEIGKYPDCKHLDLKRYYQNPEE